MAAIKEYPFDLSDLKNKQNRGEETSQPPDRNNQEPTLHSSDYAPQAAPEEGKRRVSIMANENSKDRENQPSERYLIFIYSFFISIT